MSSGLFRDVKGPYMKPRKNITLNLLSLNDPGIGTKKYWSILQLFFWGGQE